MIRHVLKISLIITSLGLVQPTAWGARDLGDLGRFTKWQKVEFVLTGPDTSVTAPVNPCGVPVDVSLRSPVADRIFKVPAFYDGDGNGNLAGNVWKVRFAPDAVGRWTFTSSSSTPQLDGCTGSFTVGEAGTDTTPYLKRGRLQYAGKHYLKFADGDYWVKGGADDPENFLGKAFGDWQGKKKAVDYLSSKGCNSIYVMTNTIAPGDGDDTWPWLGDTSREAKSNAPRIDPARMARWEDFFNHCDQKGVVLHVVLLDDSAWHDFDHRLYYREMIARFGHHLGLIWNIGEEATEAYSKATILAHAALIREFDPYPHPLTVHLGQDWPFMGNPDFDLTSIQTTPGGSSDFAKVGLPDFNKVVMVNRLASESAGRPLAIMIDEPPGITGVDDGVRRRFRSECLYPIYLAGGGLELHYRIGRTGAGKSLTLQDLEPLFSDMHRARRFVESLPFVEMAPYNELLSTADGGYCLAKPGLAYGIYLKGGKEAFLDLNGVSGTYEITWYEVTTGRSSRGGTITGGGRRSLGAPPREGEVACAIRLRK